jgi:hypothetical protein
MTGEDFINISDNIEKSIDCLKFPSKPQIVLNSRNCMTFETSLITNRGFGFIKKDYHETLFSQSIYSMEGLYTDEMRFILVDLDFGQEVIYYYPDLYLKIHDNWVGTLKGGMVYKICGDYISVPFSKFKSNKQIEKFCILHFNRIKKKYEDLVIQQKEENKNFWNEFDRKEKVKQINKKIKVLNKDF